MENQHPTLTARSSAELAENDELHAVRSSLSNYSAADTICVAGGPSVYMLPGVPRAPFARLYEGDVLSWEYIPDDVAKEALDAYVDALRGPHLSRYIRRVLAAGAVVPGRLKWLASGQRARLYARFNTLPPRVVEEVRMMVGRYLWRIQMAEYGRMTRVLLAHAAEVERVMGDEIGEDMCDVAVRMYERAVHENYGVAHVVSTTEYVRSAELGAGAVYLMEIPDCQECGLYDCRRCGKSRQLQLIELYKEWKEPVIMVHRRIDALVEKEERRLLGIKGVEQFKKHGR